MSCIGIAVCETPLSMGSQETLPLTFDAAASLLVGESIQSATASLMQLDNGTSYPSGLQGAVLIDGAALTQTVTALLPRKRYRLTIQYHVASNKIWAPYLDIECPD